jgi:D-glycero-alpha-D-manno-heptose-7-phosphate kinase
MGLEDLAVIISRTPFRVSLFGGGSDFREYYRRTPGAVLTLAINRYMYVTVNRRFDDSIRVSYTRTEIVPQLRDLQHELIREAMRVAGVTKGVEITTIADLPAGIGLGSSSVLTVGILNALFAYRGVFVPAGELAAQACKIEIDVLGKPIGKQDQYIAAHGGFKFVRFFGDERVTVEPMYCRPETAKALVDQLLLFYTGITRTAGSILTQAKRRMTTRTRTQDAIDRLVEMADAQRARVAANDVSGLGPALDAAWQLKKEMGSRVSTGQLDGYYDRGRKAGATGGKIAGAGGGGCLLLCVPEDARTSVRRAMAKCGLREIPLELEPGGTSIIHASDWEAPTLASDSSVAPFRAARRMAPPVTGTVKVRAS